MPAPEGSAGAGSVGESRQGISASMVVRGRLDPQDVGPLCARLSRLVRQTGADVVVCDVRGLVEPDVAAVDALARLQLTARRLGGRIRLRGQGERLRELLRLAGLDDVLR